MSHDNYIYKRNHWQLHSKNIQKERYPWLSYQCWYMNQRSFFFGLLGVDWGSGWIPQEKTEACSSKMAWPVLHGVTGPITPSRLCVPLQLGRFAGCFGGSCVSIFFFLGQTTEKQNLWFKCFFRQFACVVRFTTTIYNYVCLWSFALNFFGVARKLGASHPIQPAATKNLTHSLFMTSHPNFPHMSPFTQKETNILKV